MINLLFEFVHSSILVIVSNGHKCLRPALNSSNSWFYHFKPKMLSDALKKVSCYLIYHLKREPASVNNY